MNESACEISLPLWWPLAVRIPQDTFPFPKAIRSSIAFLIYRITHHSVGKLVKVLHIYIFEQIRIRNDKEWLHP